MWFLWISYVGRFEKYGNQRRVNESVIDLTVVSLPPDSATHGIETHVDSRVDELVEIDKDDLEDVEPGEQLTNLNLRLEDYKWASFTTRYPASDYVLVADEGELECF